MRPVQEDVPRKQDDCPGAKPNRDLPFTGATHELTIAQSQAATVFQG